MRSTKDYKLAVLDLETDPFKRDRYPEPFAGGFWDGETYMETWSQAGAKNPVACVNLLLQQIVDHADRAGHDYLIYAHNGGKFDFWYMWDWIDSNRQLFIINGRLTEFSMAEQRHIFRDSMAIAPFALAEFEKTKVDYRKFEWAIRERHKAEIRAYLKSDCVNLHKLVTGFANRYTDKKGNVPLTIGQAAIRELQALHPFERLSASGDARMRRYYHGGRVQCFAAGVLKGPWKVYDVNSMYPHVMEAYDHPLSQLFHTVDRPPGGEGTVWFTTFKGSNRQALPVVVEGKGLDFTSERGAVEYRKVWRPVLNARGRPTYDEEGNPVREVRRIPLWGGEPVFRACSHELLPAIAAGMVTVDQWLEVLVPAKVGRFGKFVKKFSAEKIAAKQAGDRVGELLAKFTQNAASGKTGQDPSEFADYILVKDHDDPRLEGDEDDPKTYRISNSISIDPCLEVYERPIASTKGRYYNVSIAASITSAARAVLTRGADLAVEPVYCDTDSLVCRDFKGPVDPFKTGSWKLEAEADYIAIGGKKMYCLYNVVKGKVVPVKWASKGGKLTPIQIIRIAKGEIIEETAEVPTYSLKGGKGFQTRKFQKTVDRPLPFK